MIPSFVRTLRPFGASACFVAAALLPVSLPAQTFVRITGTGPHVTDQYKSLSGAWGDYDGDGDPDLFISSISHTDLFRNDGMDVFTAVPGPPSDSTVDMAHTMGAFADYDNDGDLDIYRCTFTVNDSAGNITVPLPNQLFRNDGGSFTPIATSGDSTYTPAASWVDYDLDGDLDIFAPGATGTADLLYRNDGASFTQRFGLPFQDLSPVGVLHSWLDYDHDGDSDLLIVNHGAPNQLFRNLLQETGVAESFEADTTSGLTDEGSVIDFGMSFGDYDNDGDLDGFLATAISDRLFRNNGDGTFTRITGIPLVMGTLPSSCGAWGDYDNDGDLDLFVPHAPLTSQAPDLWRNDGGGIFVAMTSADVGAILNSLPGPQAAEWGDYDNDGDLDMYIVNFAFPNASGGAPRANRMYRNEGTSNHWLHLDLVGVASNRSAVGAVVRVKATIGGVPTWQMRDVVAGPTGFEFQRELRQHFGLGDATSIDSLVIEWPSGALQTITAVAVDQILTVNESDVVAVPLGGLTGVSLLGPGHPNPFSGAVSFAYAGNGSEVVDVVVFDVLGRRVRQIHSAERLPRGARIEWDGRDASNVPVAAGVYFVRLATSGATEQRRIVRMR